MTKQAIDECIAKIELPGEDDYLWQMTEGACATWRNEAVQEGDLKSFDGAHLRYYLAIPKTPQANIVLIHGLCEFFDKYREFAWTLYRAGFAFFFLEQRGHGKSAGKLPEPDYDVVHIDSYDTYLKDQEIFLRDVVNHHGGGRKNLIIGHSMGGAIAALLLENVPGYFDAAFFCSPMFRLKHLHYPLPAIAGLHAFASLAGKMQRLAPGERHFPTKPAFSGSSARSMARYNFMFAQRVADRDKQTYGVSYGWVIQSLYACRRLLKDADKIKLPVVLMTAGEDRLIDAAGYSAFCARVPQAKRIHYKESGHELYNADTKTRRQFYKDLLHLLLSAV